VALENQKTMLKSLKPIKKPTHRKPEKSGFTYVGLLANGSVALAAYPLFSHPSRFHLPPGADFPKAPLAM
jgi:hypothetical protein